MGIGWGEILVLLFLILLLFGGKRLPELARSMGQAVNEFKRGLNSDVSNTKRELTDEKEFKYADPDTRNKDENS